MKQFNYRENKLGWANSELAQCQKKRKFGSFYKLAHETGLLLARAKKQGFRVRLNF